MDTFNRTTHEAMESRIWQFHKPSYPYQGQGSRNMFFLSTIFSVFLLLILRCSEKPYYDYYDKAVRLYYSSPSQPNKALRILKGQCQKGRKGHHLSCYNWGVFLEMRGNYSKALKAYEKAYELQREPSYLAAAVGLAERHGDSGSSKHLGLNTTLQEGRKTTPYLSFTRRIVTLCRNQKAEEALLLLEKVYSEASQRSIRPSREFISHPFFRNCFSEKDFLYRKILLLSSEEKTDYQKQIYQFHARAHQFHSLWDIELHLQNLTWKEKSSHPITLSWQNTVAAALQKDHGNCFSQASQYFKLLDDFIEKNSQNIKRREKAISLQRAAALLIQQDRIFSVIRDLDRSLTSSQAKSIHKLIQPYLE